MKIAVMGAGAVGCYYGGKLARAGHDVILIGRSQHIEAIEQRGLRFEAQSLDEYIPLAATTQASAVQSAELVLFCVKSTDTQRAALDIKPFLAPNAQLLSLQNGVENTQELRKIVPQEVITAVVYVALDMAGPGHVRHHGRGELVLEPAGAHLAQTLIAAGIPVEISADARGALWTKLIINCAYNALSAIVQRPYGQLAQSEGVSAVLRDVIDECLAVARAEGVVITSDIHAAVQRIAQTMPEQYSSTAQDLARGKRSEIDHLNGLIARRGQALGIPTPTNRLLHTLVKLIESK